MMSGKVSSMQIFGVLFRQETSKSRLENDKDFPLITSPHEISTRLSISETMNGYSRHIEEPK
jgi:hypothetical protein